MEQSLMVGTKEGLYKLSDRSQARYFADHEVTALTRTRAGWIALVDGVEAVQCNDGGEWTEVAEIKRFRANCILPTSSSGAFIGTSEAHLFELKDGVVFPVKSFDEAPGREKWFTPWGGPPDLRCLAAGPSGVLYANVHVGGVLRSPDGVRWQPTLDIATDVHQVLFDPDSGLLFAASAQGLGVSRDSGETWRFDSAGLHGKYLRAVTVVGHILLVTASTGYASRQAAVYRRPVDSAGAFQRCAEGLPEWFTDNIDTHCLVASDTTVAFGTSQGSVFISEDTGVCWKQVVEDLPAVRCLALSEFARDGNRCGIWHQSSRQCGASSVN